MRVWYRKTDRVYGAVIAEVMDLASRRGRVSVDDITATRNRGAARALLGNLWRTGRLRLIEPGKKGANGWPAVYGL